MKLENDCSVRLQACVRAFLARVLAVRAARQRYLSVLVPAAALKVQTQWRRYYHQRLDMGQVILVSMCAHK